MIVFCFKFQIAYCTLTRRVHFDTPFHLMVRQDTSYSNLSLSVSNDLPKVIEDAVSID